MAQAQLDIILNAQKYQRDLVKTLGLTEKQAAAQALRMARDGQKAADKAANAQKSAAKRTGIAWKNAFTGAALFAAVSFAKRAIEAISEVAREVTDLRNELNDLATRTGLTADTLQSLKLASKASGQEFSKVSSIVQKIPKLMADIEYGSKTVEAAFDNLGVKTRNVDGTMRDADSVFRDIVDSLDKIEDPTLRAARASAIFGRTGGDLLVAIGGGAEQFQAFDSFARSYGIDTGPKAAAAAAQMQVELAALDTVTEGAKDQFAGFLTETGALRIKAKAIAMFSIHSTIEMEKLRDAVHEVGLGFGQIVSAGSLKEAAVGIRNVVRGLTAFNSGESTAEIAADKIAKFDKSWAKLTETARAGASTPGSPTNPDTVKTIDTVKDAISELDEIVWKSATADLERQRRSHEQYLNYIAEQREAAKQAAIEQEELDRRVADSKVALAATSANAIGSIAQLMAGKSEASQRRAWAVSKAAGVAESVLNTAMAISNALADVPYPANLFAAASAGVAGAAAAAQVAATPAPSFYEGGSMGLPYADPRGQLLSLRAHPREKVKIERQGDDSGGGTMFGQTFLNGRQIATSTFEQLRRGGAPAAAMSRIAGRMGHTPAFRSA